MSNLNKLDLEKELKRSRSLLKTDEGKHALRIALVDTEPGREVLEAILGKKIQVASQMGAAGKPVVAVLIPSHRQPAHETWAAIDRMVKYAGQQIDIVSRDGVSASIVSWTRNQLIADCYKDSVPFTHVLFIDDDAVPPEDAIMRLLAHKVDIVAGAMTVRKDPPIPNFRSFDESEMTYHTAFEWNGEGLIEVGAVGTGFMLISRHAIETVGQYYLDCSFEQKFFGMPKEVAEKISAGRKKSYEFNHNRFWFELLKQPFGDGEFGEDISFCFKARQCGLKIYVDTAVRPGHIGNYPYSLDDFFYHQADVLEQEARKQRRMDVIKGKPKEGEPDMKISLLVPTRGRPENVDRLLQSLIDTAEVMPEVVLYCDDDDATMAAYDNEQRVNVVRGPRITLSECWNECAKVATGDILMHAGDDLVFKTKGWDRMVVSAFQHCPDRILFVHGEDGHWGERFGTHGFLHRKWVEATGYFVPPYFSSDFNDTWLNEVANQLGRRVYLPFVTDHLHPLCLDAEGKPKAEWDKTHNERLERHKKDKVEELYASLADKRAEDAAKLQKVITEHAVAV